MSNGWNKNNIKALFSFIEENNHKNIPIIKSFEIFAKKTNKNMLSVRNFYYAFVKLLKINKKLQTEYDIDISKHQIQKFIHFDKKQEEDLISQIEKYTKEGFSVREACQNLSNGDIKTMIRLQNKYQNHKNKCKIITFPVQKQPEMPKKLTNDEINSLFLGLVKLVREQAFGERELQVKQFLEATSELKQKQAIETQSQQNQIEILKTKIKEQENKNEQLNEKLRTYRVEFVSQKIKNYESQK